MRNNSRREKGYVYFLYCPEAQRLKIGFSVNIKQRMGDLSSGSPFPIKLLKYVRAEFMVEQALLLLFDRYRVNKEWFRESKGLMRFIKSLRNGAPLTVDMLAKKILAK